MGPVRATNTGINLANSDLLMNPSAPSPGLAAGWLRSNLFYALLLAAAGLAACALRSILGTNLGFNAPTMLLLIAAIVLYAAASGYGAMLVGRVLRDVLPEMPLETWVIWYSVGGALSGLFVFLLDKAPDDARLLAAPLEEMIAALMLSFLIGAVFGAIAGSIQAFILRWSARGLGRWIAMSTLGCALAFVVTFAAGDLWPVKGGLSGAIVAQVLISVNLMIVALVMLLAVKRLRPH
jgi:ABC-type multidrug transport system fused ATPase/permease subunit